MLDLSGEAQSAVNASATLRSATQMKRKEEPQIAVRASRRKRSWPLNLSPPTNTYLS